ncbi:MAG TPA: glycosyltransferase family 39 protein [Trebonia sp.]
MTWAAPVVVTAALGLFEIGVPQLWRDELASWSAASRTLPQLWAMVHNIDAVLGIYYFGLHLWMAVFGDSATAMRLPSVIAMAAAAGVVGLIGRRLGGNVAGLASGLVFALIPSVSRYAQEARPYAFATLFAALATLTFLRAMERPTWLRWVIYAIFVAAAGAANLIAVTVCAGHLLIVLWDFLQRTVRIGGDGTPESGRSLPGGRLTPEGSPLLLKRFVLAVILGAILVSPLVIEGHSQQSWQIGGVPSPQVAELVGVHGGLWQELFSSLPAAAVIMLLAVLALLAAPDTRRRSIAAYALVFAIAPVVAVWIISRGPTSYWTFRYMLFSITGWAIGAGLCISFVAERARRSARMARLAGSVSPRFAVAAVIVAVVGLVGIHDQLAVRQNEAHNLWAYPEMPNNGTPVDYQAAAAVIAANERPGDGIVFQTSDENHYQVDTAMTYYLRGKLPTPIFQAQTQVQTNSLQPASCDDQSTCITGNPRIWVVYVDHLAADPFSALPSSPTTGASDGGYLQIRGYQAKTTWQENGITVALLTVD